MHLDRNDHYDVVEGELFELGVLHHHTDLAGLEQGGDFVLLVLELLGQRQAGFKLDLALFVLTLFDLASDLEGALLLIVHLDRDNRLNVVKGELEQLGSLNLDADFAGLEKGGHLVFLVLELLGERQAGFEIDLAVFVLAVLDLTGDFEGALLLLMHLDRNDDFDVVKGEFLELAVFHHNADFAGLEQGGELALLVLEFLRDL